MRNILQIIILILAFLLGIGLYFGYTWWQERQSALEVAELQIPEGISDASIEDRIRLYDELDSLIAEEGFPVDVTGEGNLYLNESELPKIRGSLDGTLYISGNSAELSPDHDFVREYTLKITDEGIGDPRLVREKGDLLLTTATDDPNILYGSSFDPQAADGLALFEYVLDSGELRSMLAPDNFREMALAWSGENELLAYSYLNMNPVEYESTLDAQTVAAWSTIVFGTKVKEVVKELPETYMPHWAPDGKTVLYTKPDGIYAYDLVAEKQQKVIRFEGTVLATTHTALSADAKYLLVTTPGNNTITLYGIDWTGSAPIFTILYQEEKPGIQHFWPRFSYDGTHFVVQAVEPQGEELTNGRIEIYAVPEPDVLIHSRQLAEFDFFQLFTNSWTK